MGVAFFATYGLVCAVVRTRLAAERITAAGDDETAHALADQLDR